MSEERKPTVEVTGYQQRPRRTTEQWLNAQRRHHGATDKDIKPLFICNEGRVLEGWVNTKNGQRILTCLRRANAADHIRAGVIKAGRKLGLLKAPGIINEKGLVDQFGQPLTLTE